MPKEAVNLKNLSLSELETWVLGLGEKPFRARQLARWMYGKGVWEFSRMTNLAKEFRKKLEASVWISHLEPEKIQTSKDGTQKLRFALRDGNRIESVLIPERDHVTLCLSTQVGCALGCKFCLTGKKGFIRNLEPAEIIDQVLAARAHLGEGKKLTNLVLMGMGEPLENFDAVVKALEILRSENGLGFSHRRVTVSTAGIIPKIEALFQRPRFVMLAISLNASTDEGRSRLMPINRKYPLKDLLGLCRRLPLDRREKITFEYVLIQGVNDSEEDARRVVDLLRGIRAKVNLIPFNEYPQSPFRRPEEKAILRFREILMEGNLTALIRQSKGADILAACGQLAGDETGIGDGGSGIPRKGGWGHRDPQTYS
jgi:23S rRNA (adenine2503-C2)-methyltransferase